MDLEKAITTRISVRGYKPTPVPQKVIQEILDKSCRAPSGGNFQPWEFAVCGGSVLHELKKAISEKVASGVKSYPDVPRPASLPDIYLRRQRENRQRLWQALGIGSDAQKQEEFRTGKGSRFFDAPHAIFIYCDKTFGMGGCLIDIGCLIQNILLIAHSRGLGACPMGAVVSYPDVVRQILKIPDTKHLIIGIAIGYLDNNDPANKHRSQREPVENLIQWHSMVPPPTTSGVE